MPRLETAVALDCGGKRGKFQLERLPIPGKWNVAQRH
jgi:hypothetical protein